MYVDCDSRECLWRVGYGSQEWIDHVPELPNAMRERFVKDYQSDEADGLRYRDPAFFLQVKSAFPGNPGRTKKKPAVESGLKTIFLEENSGDR
jgi:hypothetical protein